MAASVLGIRNDSIIFVLICFLHFVGLFGIWKRSTDVLGEGKTRAVDVLQNYASLALSEKGSRLRTRLIATKNKITKQLDRKKPETLVGVFLDLDKGRRNLHHCRRYEISCRLSLYSMLLFLVVV
jgi:hypothetical protein